MGLGSRGIWLTGIVQEEHQRDPPGQHGVPGPYQNPRVEERPGRHRLGPGPHPEEAPRGAGSPREGPRPPGDWWIRDVGGAGLGYGGCLLDGSCSRVGPRANRCLKRLEAGPARAQPVTAPPPAPTSQVTLESQARIGRES